MGSQVPDCIEQDTASCTAQRPRDQPLLLSWNLSDSSRSSPSSHFSPLAPSLSLDSLETSWEVSSVTEARPAPSPLEVPQGPGVVEVTVLTISLEVRTSWSAGRSAATTSPRARARTSAGRTG